MSIDQILGEIMLSQDAAYRLDHAVTDDKVGDEIAARLISSTPANPAAAQAILDILDSSDKMNASIAERLYNGLAGDAEGRAGRELSKKINGMVAVLQAKADGNEVLHFASFIGQVAGMTTSVTINANVAGAAGNATLVADSIQSVTVLISDWNIANPANQLTLSAGNGAQVPTANIVLSGGAAASDSNLAPAKAAMGSEPMSADSFECLVHALGSRPAAEEMKAAYNAMIVAVQAIV